MRSLRWQWFAIGIVVTTITIVTLAGWLAYEFHDHLEEQQVAELALQLDAVTANLPELAGDNVQTLPRVVVDRLADPRWHRPYSGWYWQVERLDRSQTIWTSRSLWDFRLAWPESLQLRLGETRLVRNLAGPDHQQLLALIRQVEWEDGSVWRVSVARDQAQLAALEAEFRQEVWGILAGAAALLLVGGLFQWLLGVRPLQRLARALDAVERGEAAQVAGNYPQEIANVVAALNTLLRSQREQSETARRQTAELAHALKTPLAAILQIARQEAPQPWAAAIVDQAETAHAHVRHYLAMARAEVSRSALGKRAELATVLARTVAAMETIFAEKALRWECHWPDSCAAVGDARDLTEVVGNLLENAARHARSVVAVRVEAATHRGCPGWRVVIEDDGPGFCAGEGENNRATEEEATAERAGASPAILLPQAGLGLQVVQRITEALGGSITWAQSPRYGGALVMLFLPNRFVAESH